MTAHKEDNPKEHGAQQPNCKTAHQSHPIASQLQHSEAIRGLELQVWVGGQKLRGRHVVKHGRIRADTVHTFFVQVFTEAVALVADCVATF